MIPFKVVRRPVIEVTCQAGRGVEGDPVREVKIYTDDDGRVLASFDPLTEIPEPWR